MTTNRKSEIKLNSLDFDTIKQDLINYFSADPTFNSYDFEGSALNIMMDVLAFNTHKAGMIANMSANEMFLDSAQLRQSIVSHAKHIGYTPRSVRCAKAEITIRFDLSSVPVEDRPASINFPSGTRFGTSHSYIFSTAKDLLIYPTLEDSAIYEITDVEIFEGYRNQTVYTMNYSQIDQRFPISDIKVDTTTLSVNTSDGTAIHEYVLNEDLNILTPDDKKYFLHQNPDNTFEVSFGDGILGRKPFDGSSITLGFIASTGEDEANNIDLFTKLQRIDGYSNYTIETQIKSFGGAQQEDKEEIRFRSNKMWKSQKRAVTVEDYENFLLKEYPFIESMSVWGGEYNEPPIYGKVFFAIKPKHTDILSDNLKAKIKEELIKKWNIVTVIPEIVDPDYIYTTIDTNIIYQQGVSTKSENVIIAEVYDNIVSHFERTTEKFNAPFYFSPLVTTIDATDHSIVSSLSGVILSKRFYPQILVEENREIKFSNSIIPNTVTSSYFNCSGLIGEFAKSKIVDDGSGRLQIVNCYTNSIIKTDVGTVDYETGLMAVSVKPTEVPPDTKDIRIYATPVQKNIFQGPNQIIVVDRSIEKEECGRLQGISIESTIKQVDYK